MIAPHPKKHLKAVFTFQLSRKTVSQQTVNKGRQFYVCPNGVPGDPTSGCRFFQWADAGNPGNGGGGHPGNRGRGRGGSRGRGRGARSFGGGGSGDSGMDAIDSWPPPGPIGGAGASQGSLFLLYYKSCDWQKMQHNFTSAANLRNMDASVSSSSSVA